jgi:predicted nucleic acid-binding protein
LQAFSGRLILPVTILVETAYLIHARLGHPAMRRFVEKLSATSVQFEALVPVDVSRIHELLSIYADMELDFVDASVVAIAERFNIRHIMTVDQRDFRVIRPRHCEYFDILPQ